MTSFLDGKVKLHAGNCAGIVEAMPDCSVDSVVTDPPYALVSISKRLGKPGSAPIQHGTDGAYARAGAGFMGKTWDTGEVAFDPAFWVEVLRVAKPGAWLAAFGGTRTYHRLACAIEDAGWEIRDQAAWCYGSGFPKSHDVSKGIDKAAGATREVISEGAAVKRMIPGADQNKSGWEKDNGREYVPTVTAPATPEAAEWEGWGTALKPAWEPICLARKPLIGTVAQNVLMHGTGAINIDGCRVESDGGSARCGEAPQGRRYTDAGSTNFSALPGPRGGDPKGRFPANIIHDGSPEVLAAFGEAPGAQRAVGPEHAAKQGTAVYGDYGPRSQTDPRNDSGSAARFFYGAKADADDRLGFTHPTIKPVDLMQWLVRLVTPRGGLVLDPFAGTGTTGEAAWREGMRATLIERDPEYQAFIARRMDLAVRPTERAAMAKTKGKIAEAAGPLFGDAA